MYEVAHLPIKLSFSLEERIFTIDVCIFIHQSWWFVGIQEFATDRSLTEKKHVSKQSPEKISKLIILHRAYEFPFLFRDSRFAFFAHVDAYKYFSKQNAYLNAHI